jgi:hypothetical protein
MLHLGPKAMFRYEPGVFCRVAVIYDYPPDPESGDLHDLTTSLHSTFISAAD